MLTIISGAFGIFRRDIVVKVGGFSRGTVGEDYDLVIKIHKYMHDRKIPYAMRYVPEPVCWTEAPETLRTLSNQRKRWQRGALEVFFKNMGMFLHPRYGKLGMVAFLNNFIVDVFGPISELIGYILIPIFWAAGVLNVNFVFAYISVFFLFGVFISACSLILEEMELRRCSGAGDLALLGLVSIIENFGYRQLSNVWRVMGWWQFIKRQKEWGEMTRIGPSLQK